MTTAKKLRTCLLCESTSAGTAVAFTRREKICDWCDNELTRSGRAWCAAGRHVVDAALMRRTSSRCKACDAARNRAQPSSRDRSAYGKHYRATHQEQIKAYYARPEVLARRRVWRRGYYRRNADHFRAIERQRYRRRVNQARQEARRRYWMDPTKPRAKARRYALRKKLAIVQSIVRGTL